jgi:hypothetical protein
VKYFELKKVSKYIKGNEKREKRGIELETSESAYDPFVKYFTFKVPFELLNVNDHMIKKGEWKHKAVNLLERIDKKIEG